MDLWGFAALAVVLVAIPGPAVTLVMKQSLVRGRKDALRTALGVFSADLFWVAAAVVGLTAIIVASQPLLLAIRILGAMYLCWLGATLLLRRKHQLETAEQGTGTRRLRMSPFTEGVMCDLSNPKTLLVFTSVIPQFLPADGGNPAQAALLGVTFAALGLISLLVYAFVFGRIGFTGLQSRVSDALLRVSGAILIAFGIRLATE